MEKETDKRRGEGREKGEGEKRIIEEAWEDKKEEIGCKAGAMIGEEEKRRK